jgi:hypothetical protein
MPQLQKRPIPTENTENTPDAVNHQPATIKAGASGDSSIHAWLMDRIAGLDRKRQTAWQKVCTLLLGKR